MSAEAPRESGSPFPAQRAARLPYETEPLRILVDPEDPNIDLATQLGLGENSFFSSRLKPRRLMPTDLGISLHVLDYRMDQMEQEPERLAEQPIPPSLLQRAGEILRRVAPPALIPATALGVGGAAVITIVEPSDSTLANGMLTTGGGGASCSLPKKELLDAVESGGLAYNDYNGVRYGSGDVGLPVEGQIIGVPPRALEGNRLLKDCAPGQEVVKDEVQEEIDAWITPNAEGQYNKVPISDKFTHYSHYTILNDFNPDGGKIDMQYPEVFQGKLLASEVVNGHLIVYFGQEDWTGAQYYIALNAGKLNNEKVYLNWKSIDSDYPIGSHGSELSSIQMKKFVKKHKGEVVAFSVQGQKNNIRKPKYKNLNANVNRQLEVAKALILYSSDIASRKTNFDPANIPPELQGVINTRVTVDNFDPTKLPLAYGIFNK